MNSLDSTNLPVTPPATAPIDAGSSTQIPPSTAAPVSSPPVTKELAAMQVSSQAVPTAVSTTSALQKVAEALVGVAQALVSIVTTLLAGGKMSAANSAQSGVSPSGVSSVTSGGSGANTSNSTSVSPQNQNSNGSSTSAGTATGSQQSSTSQASRSVFDVTRNDVGQISVRTLDGFLIRAEGKDEAWTITGPDGKTTRIWGDPHVQESDGKKWDFLNRSTFQFGNNKVTVEVVPAANKTTLTSRITIYSASERVTIDGIDKNKPSVVAVSNDGKQHDDGLADGVTYKRTTTNSGEAWTSNLNGKVM